jgi:hypothetical protein
LERRLAEARAKRQAVLAKRDSVPASRRPGPGPVEARREAPVGTFRNPRIEPRSPWPSAKFRAFAAGCLVGALVTGITAHFIASPQTGPEPVQRATAAVTVAAAGDRDPPPVVSPSVSDGAAADGAAAAAARARTDEPTTPTIEPAVVDVAAVEDPAAGPDQGFAAAAAIAVTEALMPGSADATSEAMETSAAAPAATEAVDVAVLAPESVPAGDRDGTVGRLREEGWPTPDVRSSPFTVSETHVRFYHPQDRAPAEALARTFDAETRDFSRNAQVPAPGRLELWLAGESSESRPDPG